MPEQVRLPIAVNEVLAAEGFALQPITWDLVCARMELGREALEKQPLPAALKSTPSSTPVTPTDRFTSIEGRIAESAENRGPDPDIALIARRALVAQLQANRDRLLHESEYYRQGDPRCVQLELAASVLHFRLYDVLTGGGGTDQRSLEEISWERRLREASTPSAREWVLDRKVSAEASRMRPLFELQISYDDWEEIY